MAQDFHMARFEEYRAKGMSAYRAGRWDDARHDLLCAAEHLFKLARETTAGPLREQRISNATRLVDMARRIDPGAPPPAPAGAAARERTSPARGKKGAAPPGSGRRAAASSLAPGEDDDERKRFKQAERPGVRFADVAGLDDVKEEIRLKLIYPIAHADTARRYGIRMGGGVLLYGPPGTGKTLIARAIAGEIEAAFFTVKPSEIMSKWVGEAEQNIEELFKAARAEPLSVIFIDEIEALVPRRRDSQSSVMQRVVPQILAELEGFDTAEKSPILFLGATNEPWSLDPAILRPGRFDARIYIGLPDLRARRAMIEMYLRGRPVEPALDLDRLAGRLEGFSGADIRNLCDKAAAEAFLAAIEAGGEERPIDAALMETMLGIIRPSVRPEDLAKFQRYAEVT